MAWLLKECFFLKQILGSREKKREKMKRDNARI